MGMQLSHERRWERVWRNLVTMAVMGFLCLRPCMALCQAEQPFPKTIDEYTDYLLDDLVKTHGEKFLEFAANDGPLTEEESALYIGLFQGYPPDYFHAALMDILRNRPLDTFLRDIISDDAQEEVVRANALYCLSRRPSDENFEFTIAFMNKNIKPYMTSLETHMADCALTALGYFQTERAVDTLFEMMTLPYWERKVTESHNTQEAPWNPEKYKTLEHRVYVFRILAYQTLALTGNLRAVHAINTGEGIPSDLGRPSDITKKIARDHSEGRIPPPDESGIVP